ncbi:hypothetical protein [Streptomyces sp. NPDC046909]|uniref:hypothetical protein n=1 Tax=Streptomyces sp. NPDC046909 TaxID=3155617 RepID=UPI0033F935DA
MNGYANKVRVFGMAPSAKVFFGEVRLAYSGVSARLGFVGPEENLDVVPAATYRGDGLVYEVCLDWRAGDVDTWVDFRSDAYLFHVGLEALALSLEIVEKRGGISYSARNLKQMKNSLEGQAAYVDLVHPIIAAGEVERLMVEAGAQRFG